MLYICEYYKKGAIKESVQYDSDDFVLGKSETTFRESPYALPTKEESWTYEKASGENQSINYPTEYEYDEKDRKVLITLPDETKIVNKIKIEKGLIVSETIDQKNVKTRQYIDSYENIHKVEKYGSQNNLLTSASYEYDPMNQMTVAKDMNQNEIKIEYDILGRKKSLSSIDGGTYKYEYNEEGELWKEFTPNSLVNEKAIEYVYDNFGRIKQIKYTDGTQTEYEYGTEKDKDIKAVGKVLSITDKSGKISYEYGSLGQVEKEAREIIRYINSGTNGSYSATMKYTSDYLGRMEKIEYPDGEEVVYSYDAGGQVTKVEGRFSDNSEPYKYVNDIGYDEYGQRVFIEYGNGVKTEYEYNPERRWLNKIKTSKDSNVYQNIKYEFDKVGNVNGYINDCLTALNGNYITKQEYEYDELYQLTKVTGYTESNKYKLQTPDLLSEYTQEFKFDSIGNMTQKKSTEWVKYNRKVGDDLNYNTLEYTIMPGYAHRVQNIGGRYFEYDAAGNIIVEQDGKIDLEDSSKYYKIEQIDENKYIADSAWGYYTEEDRENKKTKVYRRTYEWDDKNQLIKSQDDNVTVCYTYGSDGQRASKYTENSETLYTNNFWVFHVSGSVRNGAGIINKNIYLGKMRVVTKVKEAYDAMEITERQCQYFYHSDHLGSAQLVTDNKGNEYQRIEYTPYGETWIDLKATQNDLVKLNYKFTAKELDEETGLYYYGARYLDPKYSMWISTDPALGEYIPAAGKGTADEAGKLPGIDGAFNSVNLNLYHYAGNNPVKYIDPTGMYEVLAEDGEAYIKIQNGDTLWGIIKGQSPHATDTEIISRINDICLLNGLENPNLIYSGDKLKAPNSVVPNITKDLINKMRQNASDFGIANPFYFKNKVQKGGEWDFKSNANSIYCSNPLQYYNFIFNGEIIRYDAPGNIHYGYVGKAAWWSTDYLLFKKAGTAQIKDNPNGTWSKDDDYDAYCIQKGIDLYKIDRGRK